MKIRRVMTALVISMLTSVSMANTSLDDCSYDTSKDREFRFTKADQLSVFKAREDKSAYPYFKKDRFYPESVDSKYYENRSAKLDTDSFYVRQEDSEFSQKKSLVRYYRVEVENCDTLFIQVDESNPVFSYYFDKDNAAVNGRMPWDVLDETLSISFNDVKSFLRNHEGKGFTVLPYRDNSTVKAVSIDRKKVIDIAPYDSFELLKLLREDFVLDGKRISSYSIVIKHNGQKVVTGYDPERMVPKSPLSNPDIKMVHKKDIIKGKIRFGMNKTEVIAAWGKPYRIINMPLYEATLSEQRLIETPEYPYGDKFNLIRQSVDTDRSSENNYQRWYYPDRTKKGDFIVFDENGLMKDSYQTKGLHKNEIHKDIALPKAN